MTLEQVIFYFFSTVLVAAAIGVITSRNPVHSVLFLVFAFFNSAILWMLIRGGVLSHHISFGLCGCGDGVVLVCGHDVRH